MFITQSKSIEEIVNFQQLTIDGFIDKNLFDTLISFNAEISENGKRKSRCYLVWHSIER